MRIRLREGMADFGQDLWYSTLKNILTEPVSRALGGIHVAGLDNLPAEGPALLVGNHRTISDPFLLGAVLPRRVHFVVAAFMGKLPFTRELAGSTGNIVLPVSKGGKSQELIRKARRLLKKGRLVGVFPEGMDNFFNDSPAGSVSKFHTTFARLIVGLEMAELPIVPIAFTGEEERIVVQFPAALLKVVDPHIPVAGGGRIVAPVYNKARIAIGEPLYFPEVVDLPPDARDNLVQTIVEKVRGEIVRMADAPTVAVAQTPRGVSLASEGFFDEADSL
jgi:1-acyl-sn-glycerol-3-phosphate acyltransferase